MPLELALVLLQKFPIEFFSRKCPLQDEKGLVLSKMKFQAYNVMTGKDVFVFSLDYTNYSLTNRVIMSIDQQNFLFCPSPSGR